MTGITGVEVFSLKKILKLSDGPEDPLSKLKEAAEEGGAWLKDEGADILVWGEIAKDGERLTLRLLAAPGVGPGGDMESSGIGETLELPSQFDEDMEPLITALALGTFGPTFKGARQRLGETLGGYMEQVGVLADSLPVGLSNPQEVTIFNGIGNAYVALSHLGGGVQQLDHAAKAYKKAEERVSKENQTLAWASIQNHLAAVLQAQGQMKKDPAPLRSAALVYSNVASALNVETHSDEWCSAQTQLGKVLYILAGVEGKPEYLQNAAGAYELALGACDQISAPTRWAEVTNQYGVVLLAMGEEMGGAKALEKAVGKFRDAIKVHKRETAPVLWAQTANNLGAACFALAKQNSQNALLREASDCFKGATEIYRQQGVPKQVEVIEKNLHRVKRLLISRGG
jgi:tetratricopeptide (TPR) repeat protein